MNNSTRYKDHPQQQALEERMGGKAKLLVWFLFFLSSSSLTLFVDSGSFFSGAKRRK
jgi:hypothetical protein